ncbi:MAG: class I tRNA ligase family protein [Mycobacterium leprae]
MAPPSSQVEWATAGIEGCHRFLARVFSLAEAVADHKVPNAAPSAEAEQQRQSAIKQVTEAIESFRYNTAISACMSFAGLLEKQPWRQGIETLLHLISPFAPFAAAEIDHRWGNNKSIHQQPWPRWDEAKSRPSECDLPVQIGGRVRGTIRLAVAASQSEAEAAVAAVPSLAAAISGRRLRTYLPGRIISYE